LKVLALLWLLVPELAMAQQFWTKSALLTDMFPASDRVEPIELVLEGDLAVQAKEMLGYAPPLTTYTFYVARTGDHVDGYVLFDDQVGQHEPITFAVELSAEGAVLRQEIVVYRERYGSEVRAARFRGQFVGKTADDALVAGQDVMIVSGATYSSKAMAIGVKRAVVLGRLLLNPGS
jgi:hypothetical protein